MQQLKKHWFEYMLIGATVALLTIVMIEKSRSAECPAGVEKCKVLTITPEEEQILTAPNGILHTAEQGRFIDLSAAVKYFRDRIASAPAGVKKETPAVDGNKK